MNGFVLPLQGPMQSYGDEGYLTRRDAGPFPSRSAVLGIIAAAMGVRRNDKRLLDLHRTLRVHIATICEGTLAVDYHTVQPDYPVPGSPEYPESGQPLLPKSGTVQTYRRYHHDARFVALIEGAARYVEEAQEKLKHPVFVAYLGRRSCPPATPLLPVPVNEASPATALVAFAQKPPEQWPNRRQWERQTCMRRDFDQKQNPTLDLYLDGHFKSASSMPSGATTVMRYRRDLLTALPRHYVNRPVIHLTVRLERPDARPPTNREFFDADL